MHTTCRFTERNWDHITVPDYERDFKAKLVKSVNKALLEATWL